MIPNKMTFNEKTFKDLLDIVNAFSHFFKSIYTMSNLNDGSCQTKDSIFTSSIVNILKITEDDILQAIHRLKPNMISGHDLVPNFLIKNCKSVFVQLLLYIYSI